MTSLPLVSIIIPVYNRDKEVGNALDSVLSQTYENWECIVVDDGSEDDTLGVLKSYQEKDNRLRFFERHRKPKGAPTCRNIGLDHAIGKFVIFLDSDDYLLPFCIAQRVKLFEKYVDCNFLVFPMGVKRGNTIIKHTIITESTFLIDFLSANIQWQTMCPIWRASFLKELNGFTEDYPRLNDPELMIRALVKPNIKFKVFADAPYDTVYIPSSKKHTDFNDKVYRSLRMFVPDICNILNSSNNHHYKKYLSNYLHLWFKHFYIPSGSNKITSSYKLLMMFYKQDVISGSKMLNLFLRFNLYAITKGITKHPINKLTPKTLYN